MLSRADVIRSIKESAESISKQCEEVFNHPDVIIPVSYVNRETLSVLNMLNNNMMIMITVLLDIRDNTNK